MTNKNPKIDPKFEEFLRELDKKGVIEVAGLKPDSIYIPYSKEEGHISGIAARPLCGVLFQAERQLTKEIPNLGPIDSRLTNFIIKKINHLIDYIIENQNAGVLDYNKQEELSEIYEELASIKRWAWPLGKRGNFDTEEIFQGLKRFYWTQAGEYLAGYAHEIAKDLPPMLAGESKQTTKSAKVSVGKVIGSVDVVGASVMGSIGYAINQSGSRRHDDHVYFKSTEHAGSLEATVKAGVGPKKGVPAPTGTFPGTDVNIAGLTGTAGVGLAARTGTRIKPANVGIVKVEDGVVIGKNSSHETKSLKLHKRLNQIFYGADLQEVGIVDNTFTGVGGKKLKITPKELIKILRDNGMEATDSKHPFIRLMTADEEGKNSRVKFDHYVNRGNKLPDNKRNSRVSTLSGKLSGSFSASLVEYAKAQANAELGLEVTEIVYCFGNIDIATTERTAIQKLNKNTPQYAFDNAKIINTLEKENGFSDAFDVLKDIKEITAQIHRGEFETEQMKALFKKLGDMKLISPEDLKNEKLQQKLCGNVDQLKSYIMLAYINFLAGAYDLKEKSRTSTETELNQLNKKYSGFANFVADGLWTGPTHAHTAAQEKYHENVLALEPENALRVFTASAGGGMSFGLTVGKNDSIDGRKHALTNMLGVGVKITCTAVDNHPALNRNKNDLTIDISLTGAGIDAAVLTKQLIDRFTKEPALKNNAAALAKSAVHGLQSLYNAASDVDKITGGAALPISPFSFAGSQPYGSLNLQVIYNTTAEEVDFYGLSMTNTRGLGFDTSTVTSWVDSMLPVSGSIQVGRYHSQKNMLASRFSGTTSLIGLVREVCSSFADAKEFNKEDLIPFLQKLKKNRELPGLLELGQVALNNKVKASSTKPKGAFDEIAKKSGSKCIEKNEKFKKVFLDAQHIDQAQVEKYKNAMEKLIKSDDIDKAAESLTDNDWRSIKEVFNVWKTANTAYTEMDKEFKKHIKLALHAQPNVTKINELQGQGKQRASSSINHSIRR